MNHSIYNLNNSLLSYFNLNSIESNMSYVVPHKQDNSPFSQENTIDPTYQDINTAISKNFNYNSVVNFFDDGLTTLYLDINDSSLYMDREGSQNYNNNISLATPMNTDQNQINMVTSSFGMKYLINLQEKAFQSNKRLNCFKNISITEKSFNAFSALDIGSSFVTDFEDRQNIEIFNSDIYFSVTKDFSKMPAVYWLNSSLFFDEAKELFHSCLEKIKKTLTVEWVDSINQGGYLNTKSIPLHPNSEFITEAYPALTARTQYGRFC